MIKIVINKHFFLIRGDRIKKVKKVRVCSQDFILIDL